MQDQLPPDTVIKNVKSDGNCFYRAVQVFMGHGELTYLVLKALVYEFACHERELTEQLGNFTVITTRILTDNKWSYDEDITLTANFLQRDIHIYMDTYPSGRCEVFTSEFGKSGGPPIMLLHTGGWEHGHFKAIVTTSGK